MTTAYVIQTNKGYRMFAREDLATNFVGDKFEGGAYEKPLAVRKEDHYIGDISSHGVLFTDEDKSSRTFASMLANRDGRTIDQIAADQRAAGVPPDNVGMGWYSELPCH
jgi:hypothetical protein